MLLFITAAGADAIGVEPEAVPYAFNEGTNSAGEPAAGAPTGADEAPVEPTPKRRGRPRKAAPTGADAALRAKTRDGTKQAQLIAMLRRKQGATIAQIVEATGWQPHTVRGAFAGALKKKLGLTVTSEKVEGERAGLPPRLTPRAPRDRCPPWQRFLVQALRNPKRHNPASVASCVPRPPTATPLTSDLRF